MIVLLGIGFLAGFVTAISPCVLPVLPILLAGGATGRKPLPDHRRARRELRRLHALRHWLLDKLGPAARTCCGTSRSRCSSSSRRRCSCPQLGELLERPFARPHPAPRGRRRVPARRVARARLRAVRGPGARGDHRRRGQRTTSACRAIALTLAYALGAAVPMLLIALGGRAIGDAAAGRRAPQLRLASGIVIGAVALAIAFNVDTRFQTALPGYTQALQNHVEDTATAARASSRSSAAATQAAPPRPAPARARRRSCPTYGAGAAR